MKQEIRWLVMLVFGFWMSMSAAFVGNGENLSRLPQAQATGVEAESFDEELAHAAPAEGFEGLGLRIRCY